MASKRFLMVLVDSSAARMPLPDATIASATLFSSSRFIGFPPSLPRARPGSFPSFLPQDLDTRQGLALQPFEESAAGSGYIGEAPGHAGGVERRHRIATAGYRYKLPGLRQFRRRFRDFDGAGVERLHLEGAERAVPHQCLAARQHRDGEFDAAWADVEDHVGRPDLGGIDDAR